MIWTVKLNLNFDSFIINLKKGNFELTLDTKTFGQFKFFCNISNVFYNFEQIESSGKSVIELKDASSALFTLISVLTKNTIDLNSLRWNILANKFII